jgi:hypothetical protein
LEEAVAGANEDGCRAGIAVVLEVVEAGEGLAADVHDAMAGVGECEGLAPAAGEFDAEEVFELFDLAAVEALAIGVAVGGPGEAAGVGQVEEGGQAVER